MDKTTPRSRIDPPSDPPSDRPIDPAIDPATGDRLLREARTSWWVLWPRVALAVLAAAVAAAGAAMQGTAGIALALVGGAACVLLLAGALLRRRATRLRLTDRAVVVESGLASRHTSTILLERIEAIDLDQTAWQRLTRTGTLTLRGVGSEDLRFRGLADPVGFQAEARRAINALGAPIAARRDRMAA